MVKKIIMTPKDREKYYSPLFKYFIESKELTEEEAKDKIEEVFLESQQGWVNAPISLDTRIRIKSGFQWKSHENLKPKIKTVPDKFLKVKEEDEETEIGEGFIFRYLRKYEKNWWKGREKIYRSEFDFNESSDIPLLNQLLFEELLQRRLFKNQLQNPSRDYNIQLSKSLERLSQLQIKLGITREQRADIIDKMDGNIATLSISLDEKLKNIKDIENINESEELLYSNLKAQKPPYNILPPEDKVEAMVKSGEGIVYSTDAPEEKTKVEEVAKEQKRLLNKKKEFPVGESI